MTLFRLIRGDESGATAIEYGVLGGLIAVFLIGATTLFGTSIAGAFNVISNKLT